MLQLHHGLIHGANYHSFPRLKDASKIKGARELIHKRPLVRLLLMIKPHSRYFKSYQSACLSQSRIVFFNCAQKQDKLVPTTQANHSQEKLGKLALADTGSPRFTDFPSNLIGREYKTNTLRLSSQGSHDVLCWAKGAWSLGTGKVTVWAPFSFPLLVTWSKRHYTTSSTGNKNVWPPELSACVVYSFPRLLTFLVHTVALYFCQLQKKERTQKR